MNRLLAAVAALALVPSALADVTSSTIGDKALYAPTVVIAPQAVPTTLTTVVTGDVYLIGLVISAPSSVTVTVQDMQGTPIPLVPAVVTAANTVYIFNLPFLYWCPGGLKVQASASGANYYAAWKVK